MPAPSLPECEGRRLDLKKGTLAVGRTLRAGSQGPQVCILLSQGILAVPAQGRASGSDSVKQPQPCPHGDHLFIFFVDSEQRSQTFVTYTATAKSSYAFPCMSPHYL